MKMPKMPTLFCFDLVKSALRFDTPFHTIASVMIIIFAVIVSLPLTIGTVICYLLSVFMCLLTRLFDFASNVTLPGVIISLLLIFTVCSFIF